MQIKYSGAPKNNNVNTNLENLENRARSRTRDKNLKPLKRSRLKNPGKNLENLNNV